MPAGSRLFSNLCAVARAATLCAGLVAVSLGSGCSLFHRGIEVYVPVKANAAEQYAYAVKHREQRNLDLIPIDDEDRYVETREVVRKVLAKVPEYFPEDRKSTPLAKLDLVEMDAGLDSRRAGAMTSKHALRAAVDELAGLIAEYPEYDFIQAKALFDTGQCQLVLGDYAKAQEAFYQTREAYKASPNQTIRGIAKLSDGLYNKTFVNGDTAAQKKAETLRDGG